MVGVNVSSNMAPRWPAEFKVFDQQGEGKQRRLCPSPVRPLATGTLVLERICFKRGEGEVE